VYILDVLLTLFRLFHRLTGKKLSYEHLKVFAGLSQVSAGLNQFKPHVWQKQVFAGRNPTLQISNSM